MKRITLDELNKEIASADSVVVSFNKNINKETRCGSYITIRKGMLHAVFFVGKDLQWGDDVVEVVS